jgi:hypothetical protein
MAHAKDAKVETVTKAEVGLSEARPHPVPLPRERGDLRCVLVHLGTSAIFPRLDKGGETVDRRAQTMDLEGEINNRQQCDRS